MRAALPLVALLLSCGQPSERKALDPPRGRSHADYLSSFQQTRPDDTSETDKMVLHVIDIGQGLAVLLEFPCGAILVDTGGEQNEGFDATVALKRYLDEFFAVRTDLNKSLQSLVITHPHIDHTRGIEVVLSDFHVRNVVTNGQDHEDTGGPEQTALHRWVEKINTSEIDTIVGVQYVAARDIPLKGLTSEVIDPIAGCQTSATDPVVTALWGNVSGIKDYPGNPNDHSVVLRVDYGKSSTLITGDLEFEGLAALTKKYAKHPELLDVDVYVVGHHGSRNATAPHIMKAMTPKVAIISAGPYDRRYDWTGRKFGHPNIQAVNELTSPTHGVSWSREPETVWVGVKGAWEDKPELFEQQVINRAVYSTGWDGTVAVRMYGNGWLEVDTAGRSTQ